MSSNKAKGTSPEALLVETLGTLQCDDIAQHVKVHGVTVDLIARRYKLAVFVNGCYWHRCRHCKRQVPKHNSDFWSKKFDANVRRDRRNSRMLRRQGWSVLTVWECRLKQAPKREATRVVRALQRVIEGQDNAN